MENLKVESALEVKKEKEFTILDLEQLDV